MDVLRYLASGVCAQRPDHTILIAGQPLPLEARMGGLFVGFFLCFVYLLALGRANAWLLPHGPTAVALLLGVATTAIDGLNAYAFDIGATHLYQPDLTLRLATGLAAGFAVGAFAIPVLSTTLWKEGDLVAPLDGIADLAVGYALLAVLQIATQVDIGPLLLALAVLQVGAVLTAFAVVDLYLLVLLLCRVRVVDSWRALAPLGAASIGIALLKLTALAELRSYAEHSLGIHWIA